MIDQFPSPQGMSDPGIGVAQDVGAVNQPPEIIQVWEEGQDGETHVTLDIPGLDDDKLDDFGASFGATRSPADEENGWPAELVAGTLNVAERLRGLGHGMRLVRAMGFIGVNTGCETVLVDFSHPSSVKHFYTAFGSDRVTLLEPDGEPATFGRDEAIALLNVRRANHADPNGKVNLMKMSPIKGRVDLRGLDVTGWEEPRVVAPEDASWNQES
jgi:hypothetical protein